MKFGSLYLAGFGSWLPERSDARAAVADGQYDVEELAKSDIESATVSPDESAPEMAVRAARVALARSGTSTQDIDLLLHASILHQGHDFWPAASYIAQQAIGRGVPAIEVRQMATGGFAALNLAARYLTADPDTTAALLTAADRYTLPAFNRWTSDAGIVYGDGGAAAVLTRKPGGLRILSLANISDPSIEEMHRGDDPFSVASGAAGTVDVKRRKYAYFARRSVDSVLKALIGGVVEVVGQATEEAGVTRDSVRHWIVPNIGKTLIQYEFIEPLGITFEQTAWGWGRTVGHLGPGDHYAALEHLDTNGALTAGDKVVLIGVGGGFTWSAAVLEVCGS